MTRDDACPSHQLPTSRFFPLSDLEIDIIFGWISKGSNLKSPHFHWSKKVGHILKQELTPSLGDILKADVCWKMASESFGIQFSCKKSRTFRPFHQLANFHYTRGNHWVSNNCCLKCVMMIRWQVGWNFCPCWSFSTLALLPLPPSWSPGSMWFISAVLPDWRIVHHEKVGYGMIYPKNATSNFEIIRFRDHEGPDTYQRAPLNWKMLRYQVWKWNCLVTHVSLNLKPCDFLAVAPLFPNPKYFKVLNFQWFLQYVPCSPRGWPRLTLDCLSNGLDRFTHPPFHGFSFEVSHWFEEF